MTVAVVLNLSLIALTSGLSMGPYRPSIIVVTGQHGGLKSKSKLAF